MGSLAARLSSRGPRTEAPPAPDLDGTAPRAAVPGGDENPLRAIEEAVEEALRAGGFLR